MGVRVGSEGVEPVMPRDSGPRSSAFAAESPAKKMTSRTARVVQIHRMTRTRRYRCLFGQVVGLHVDCDHEACRTLELEGLVASKADRVFVISEQLGKFAQQRWNIPTDRIDLLPNCVDPDRIMPSDPENIIPDTIGYAGSLISYEGLDTLIDAVDMLLKQGVKVRCVGGSCQTCSYFFTPMA